MSSACRICNGQQQALYNLRGYTVQHCLNCATYSLVKIPATEQLQEFYQGISQKKMLNWQYCQQLVQHSVDYYLTQYKQLTGQPANSFIDVGGGVGYHVRAAQNRGLTACLLDYAADATAFARDQLGVDWVVVGDVQDSHRLLGASRFDYVLSRHTIEHLPDPLSYLKSIARILQPQGLLQVETPNAGSWEQWGHPHIIWLNYRELRSANPVMSARTAWYHAVRKSVSGINPPKHLWGFSAKGLQLLLEQAGFNIIKQQLRPLGDRYYDPLYYVSHSLQNRHGLGRLYYFWERASMLGFRRSGSNLIQYARLR